MSSRKPSHNRISYTQPLADAVNPIESLANYNQRLRQLIRRAFQQRQTIRSTFRLLNLYLSICLLASLVLMGHRYIYDNNLPAQHG